MEVTQNHYGYGLRNDERPFAHKIPPGGNWRDLNPDEQRAFMGGAIDSGGGKVGYLRRESWDDAAHTVVAAPMAKATCQLHPGALDDRGVEDTKNHIGGVLTREYPGHAASNLDAPAKTLVSGNHGGTGGANCFYPEKKETVQIRNYNVTPQLPANGLTVAELFCGGGLMAVGLKAAGYDLIFANDFDQRAAQAYAHNIGDHVVCGDITNAEIQAQIPDVDIIAGGPPCQDYSVAGTGAGEQGERGRLVWTYLSIIERKQPRAFIFENVKGLVFKRHRQTFEALLQRFDEIGYTVSWRVINAWDYGVAQKRERVFIVGIRKDLGFTYEFPEPEPGGYRTQVLRDVIGDLPEPIANHDKRRAVISNKALSGYARRYSSGKLGGGFAPRANSWDDASPVIFGRIANEGKAFIHPDYLDNHVCFDNVGRNPTWEHANREADLNAPAPTRTEKDRCDGINPINGNPRRFTVRECLRIQSVPDWYVLPDDISLSAQYRIVGNGVASRVAYVLGIARRLCAGHRASLMCWASRLRNN